MTTTTATAKLRFIPTEGYRTTVGTVEIRSYFVAGVGWTVQIRRNGAFESAQMHAHEHQAVDVINTLVAELETAEAPAPVKLSTPKSGATKMSPAEVIVLGEALDSTGHIRRGRGVASADLASLKAMARRGFVTLEGPQFRPTGGEVTDWGKRVYKETAAAAEAAQQQQDRINRVLAYTAA
jgi:hypothetical protein